MTTAAKLLAAITANPANWRLHDLQVLARHNGVTWRQHSGSHCIFVRADGAILSVPSHGGKTLKPVYVRRFVAFIGA